MRMTSCDGVTDIYILLRKKKINIYRKTNICAVTPVIVHNVGGFENYG